MGIPLLRGRGFAEEQVATDASAVLISETMARRYWPDEPAIGGRIRAFDPENGPALTVIGVVGDAHYQSLETPDVRPMLYFAAQARPRQAMHLVARTSDPARLAVELCRTVAALEPALAAPGVRRMDDAIAEEWATARFAAALFDIFAGTAMILALIGMYGAMSYLVRLRTRELGIRAALGASRGALVRSVVWRALRLTSLGIALGVLATVSLSRVLGALLFETRPLDPLTYAGVSALLLVVATLASLGPARRATGAPPVLALRSDG